MSQVSSQPVDEHAVFRYGIECGADDIKNGRYDYRNDFKSDPPLALGYILYQPPPVQNGQVYGVYVAQELMDQKDELTKKRWIAAFIRGYSDGASQAKPYSP
jgi:hypothetical protein